jgi:hypothetical protein
LHEHDDNDDGTMMMTMMIMMMMITLIKAVVMIFLVVFVLVLLTRASPTTNAFTLLVPRSATAIDWIIDAMSLGVTNLIFRQPRCNIYISGSSCGVYNCGQCHHFSFAARREGESRKG